MSYSHPDTVLSHPETDETSEKKLLTHLDGVQENAVKLLPIETSEKIPNNEQLISDIAYLHDIGKCTQHFQRYLRDEEYEYNLKQHSEIGGLIGAYVIGEKYNSEYLQLVTYLVIKNHHSYLQKNIDEELNSYIKTNPSSNKKRERLREQINNLEDAKIVVNKILENCGSNSTYSDLQASNICNEQQRFKKLRDWTDRTPLYEDVLSLWSTLITADKLDAANLSTAYFQNTESLEYNRLTSHIAALQSQNLQQDIDEPIQSTSLSKMNQLREQARGSAIEWAENAELKQNTVYNLSLPTGFGKTYSGLSAALKLSQRKQGNIVYALPFTSIIDQVDDEIREIFNVSPKNEAYTIHHHLAETKTKVPKDKANTDIGSREEFLLAKSWNSHLTLTTFVQLFESLTTPKNSQGIKIPALKNSIIILDEPQALNYTWWRLIPKLVDFLNTYYNATVISMTATQPVLFDNSENIDAVQEILPQKDTYYSHLTEHNRVIYTTTNQLDEYLSNGSEATPDSYENIADQIQNDFNKQTISSNCAICNTVKSAKELTKQIDNKINGNFVNEEILKNPNITPEETLSEEKINIFHLTTRISPYDRRRLLKAINHSIDNKYKTCVISTQLIEAGVDISFNKIYRDLAPIPSIIQAGGRCNRNNELDTGTVVITRLGPIKEDEKVTPAAKIYNNSLPLIDATRNTIRIDTDYPEGEFIQLTNEFYTALDNIGHESYVDYSEDYNVRELDNLSLINSYEAIDVSIVSNEKKNDILTENSSFDDLSSGHKSHIFSELEEYTASIPLPYNEQERELIRSQLDINLGEQYILLRDNPTYSSKYGLQITKSTNNQFIG